MQRVDIIELLVRGGLEARFEALLDDATTPQLIQDLAETPDLIELATRLDASRAPQQVETILNQSKPGQSVLHALCGGNAGEVLASALLRGGAPHIAYGNASAARRLAPTEVGLSFAHQMLVSDAREQLVWMASSDVVLAIVELESSFLSKTPHLFELEAVAAASIDVLWATEPGKHLRVRLGELGIADVMAKRSAKDPELRTRDFGRVAFARACLAASSMLAVTSAVVITAAHAGETGTVPSPESGGFIEFLSPPLLQQHVTQLAADPARCNEIAERLVTGTLAVRLGERLAHSGALSILAGAVSANDAVLTISTHLASRDAGREFLHRMVVDDEASRFTATLNRFGNLGQARSRLSHSPVGVELTRWLARRGAGPTLVRRGGWRGLSFQRNCNDPGIALGQLGGIDELVDLACLLASEDMTQGAPNEHGERVIGLVTTRGFEAFAAQLMIQERLDGLIAQLTLGSTPWDLALRLASTDAAVAISRMVAMSDRGRQAAHVVASSELAMELVDSMTTTETARALASEISNETGSLEGLGEHNAHRLAGAAVATSVLALGPASLGGWVVQCASAVGVAAAVLVAAVEAPSVRTGNRS